MSAQQPAVPGPQGPGQPISGQGGDVATSDDPVTVLERVAARSAAQMTGENFPVALRIVPARPRGHLAAIYGFARFVDDVGDEAPGDRLALLDLVRADLARLYTGTPRLAPIARLIPLVDECAVPPDPLDRLIEANRIDQLTTRYETFADLISYCTFSADPVGRLVLYVAAAIDADNLRESDAVCSALQVLEHCQDVGEDRRRDRIYLPQSELRAADVSDAELRAGSASPGMRHVIAIQVDRAERMLASGVPLVRRVSGWSRIAVAGYVGGGLATIAALRRADYDVLARAVTPSKARTGMYAARMVVGS
ncbi:MAG: squalene synthase HpnC [Actinobacteria bacterium]|nr:squalene synthase HpnC [Actinomycetota bacterium]